MFTFRKQGLSLLALAAAFGLLSHSPGFARKPGGGAGPSAAETNPAIVYVVDDTKGGDFLVVASGDLASEIRLTNPGNSNNLWYYAPKWSPDGTRIAFWEGSIESKGPTRLYEIRPDGTGRRLVLDIADVSPYHLRSGTVWSPTGMELVFAGGNTTNLWSIDMATGTIREIWDRGWDVSISPDLDHDTPGYQGMIAFLDASGPYASAPHWRIASLEFDENGFILPIDPLLATDWIPDGLPPGIWSPDGSRLAYTDVSDPNNWWLVVEDLATETVSPLGATRGWHATWTSDGEYLVYGIYSDLMIVRSDGTASPSQYTRTRNNTNILDHDWNPAWDPAGPGGY